MEEIKLNLGCGKEPLEGFENYDLKPVSGQVKQIDLNKLPYPFDDESVDYILFSHVLEHLTVYKLDVLNELHRILRPNGKLIVVLPLYGNVVKHTSCFHGKHYLDAVLNTGRKDMTVCPLFTCEQITYTFNGLFDRIIGRIFVNVPLLRRFDFLFYGEIKWVLRRL